MKEKVHPVHSRIHSIVGSMALACLAVLPAGALKAEDGTVTWDFATAAPASSTLPTLTVSDVTQGNNNGTTVMLGTTSASSGYTGASGSNNAGAAARTGALSTASGGSAYFEFTLTPVSGVAVSIREVKFGSRSTGTGPAAFSIRTSADSFASDIASGTLTTTSSWSLRTATLGTAYAGPTGTAMVVRIYGHSGAGSPAANTANWRIDDLQLALTLGGGVDTNTYWDANGAVAGAGGATPTGTWGTDAFWSNSATGEAATVAWTAGGDAVFSAGTDATGTFTVGVTGTQSVGSLKFEEGTVLLSGGAIELSDSTPLITVSAIQAEMASDILGTQGFIKVGAGRLVLTGSKSFTGAVTLSGGTLQISSDASLGSVDNDIINNGTLATTASLSLPATRSLTGGGSLAPSTGTTLEILGSVTTTAMTLGGAGTVDLKGSNPAIGALGFTAAGTLKGVNTTVSGFSTDAAFTGTATVESDLSLGTANLSATVNNASATLTLSGALTLLPTGVSLTKSGPGTLQLLGNNSNLNRLSIGAAGTSGGKVVVNNKDSLGKQQTFFNAGTIESLTDLSGANVFSIGLSIGGREATPSTFIGQPMTFSGTSGFFTGGSTVEIRMNVMNHTTISGALPSSVSSGTLTGVAIGGTGTLTLSGVMMNFATDLKLKDSVTLELDTSDVGLMSTPAKTITLDAGTTLVIGKPGTVRQITAYDGLSGAANSVIKFDLGGTQRGVSYDTLILAKPVSTAANTVVFAGKIDVDLINGFEPALGQSFDLLDWDASITPDFTGIDFSLLPTLPAGLEWRTSNFAVNGTISIVTPSGADFGISPQPQSLTKFVGQEATFTVGVSGGTGPFTYQWFKGETPLGSPSANAFYTIPAVTSADAGAYSVVITNASGTQTSATAFLTVVVPVSIDTPPQSKTIVVGSTATFSVTVNAASTAPVTYSWRKNGEPILNTNASSYTTPVAVLADNGSTFDVVVTGPGAGNSVTSTAATLTVKVPGPIEITGNQTYTEDFNIIGTAGTVYPNGWFGNDTDGTPGLSALLVGNGSANSGRIYNFGTTGNADRAIGSVASGSFLGSFGVSFTNLTGVTLEGANVKIGFRSELWRSGSDAAVESWVFEWKLGGDPASNDGYVRASSFDIVELNPSLTDNLAKDGNAEGNYAVLPAATFTGLSGWEPGQILHIRWRDANDPGNDAGMAIDDFVLTTVDVPPPPVLRYWDVNSTVAGAGGETPTGTWGSTDTLWGTLADGTSVTEAWLAGSDAIFSAGTDATGAYTVTVTGTHDVGALIFEEGTVSLTGGTLNFSDTQPTLNVLASSASVGSVLTGTHGLLKRGAGKLTLSGTNTFTGNVLIAAGSLEISSAAQLGDAGNDIVLSNGGLILTDSLTLGADQILSGSGSVTVPAEKTLNLSAAVNMAGLTLKGAGSVAFPIATSTLSALTLENPVSLSGGKLALTGLTATYVTGSATVSNDLDLGSSVASVTVPAGATLQLDGDLTLSGTGSSRLVKSGAGTLVLTGMNATMNKLAVGSQGNVTTDGGRVIFSGKDALGYSSIFFNYGTLEALTPVTGDSSLALGLSLSGRAAAPTVLTGAAMTFQQGLDLYADAGPNTDIQLTVENHTTVQGGINVNSMSGNRITEFVVAGTGTFTLESMAPTLSIPFKVKDGVTFELDTGFNSAGSTATPLITLEDGATMLVGKSGVARSLTVYAGLSAATGSEVKFDLGGATRGGIEGGYDALILGKTDGGQTGALAVHGALTVTLSGGYVPALGTSFDLLDWDATVTPDFSGLTFNLPTLVEAHAWNLSNFATDGTITVVENSIEIVDGPDSLQVLPGAEVTFTVLAEGPGILTYQWLKNTQPIEGATSSTYSIPSVIAGDAGSYTVIVSSGSLSVTSSAAVLTVNTPVSNAVAFRTPATSPLYVGDSVTFDVSFIGTGTISYQWYKGETALEGKTSKTLVITQLALTDAGDYHVTVANGGLPVASSTVALTVADAAPSIVSQTTPNELILGVGQMMTLSVEAAGKPPLKYQWKKDGKNVGGATASLYRVPAVTAVMGGVYTCEVTNVLGKVTQKVTSNPASVGVVQTAPVVLNLAEAATATMKVTVSGPVTFDWKKNGADFLPATGFVLSADKKTLTAKPLAITDSGTYTIQVLLGSLPPFTAGTHVLTVSNSIPTTVATVTMPDGILGGAYSFSTTQWVLLNDPPSNAPTAYTSKGLPAGLKMDAKTGLISGRPTKAGDFPVVLTASNKAGKATTNATLHVDAFPAKLAGVYAAMVDPDSVVNGNLGGRLDLTVTVTGTYSGSVTLGTVKYAIKGFVDLDPEGEDDPSITLQIPRKGNPVPLPLELALTLPLNDAVEVADKQRLITGVIADAGDTADIDGWRYHWDVKNGPKADAYLNQYNFGIALPDNDPLIGVPTVPQGSGYGSFKVTADGKLKIAGKTADGETLTCASFIGPDGEVFIFQTLYTPVKGSLIGVPKIVLGATNPQNTFGGTLAWIRPANTAKTARTYKDGFGPVTVAVSGGRYSLPYVDPVTKVSNVVFDLAPDSLVDLFFTEGGINADVPYRADVRVKIAVKNKITVVSATNPSLTTLKSVVPITGAFTGSFTLTDANLIAASPTTLKRTVTFQGLIIPEGAGYVGVGYFLLPQRPTPTPPATTATTAPFLSGQVSILPFSAPE